jgi:hypothetical protein
MIYYNPRYDLIGIVYDYPDFACLLEINDDGFGVMAFTSEWIFVGVL